MQQLTDYIKVYDDALPAEQCIRYKNLVLEQQQKATRNGKDVYKHIPNSSWTELNLNTFLPQEEFGELVKLIHSYKARYEQDCPISPSLPMPDGLAPLTIKQYLANDEDWFEPHYDSVGKTCPRYLVFLFYLNDVEEGGETHFTDLGSKVEARQGRLLVFPPYWMYRHAGCKPVSNDKFILSTYYMWWK